MPSRLIAGNQDRYCPAVIESSPGRWPGVVLPRFTPGRKVTGPPAVCRAYLPLAAVATLRSPVVVVGAGAHDGPAGGEPMASSPAMEEARMVSTGEALAPVRVRQAAMVTAQIVAARTRPKRGRTGARTRL